MNEILIRLEDLKTWRANRIQDGNCSYDDMAALGCFIDKVQKIKVKEVISHDGKANDRRHG